MPTGIYKHKPFSEKRKKEARERVKKEWSTGKRKGGWKLSETNKENIRKGHLGLLHSNETITNMSEQNSVHWKGNKVGYRALHSWIQRKLGKAIKCSVCGKEYNGHKIHWANKDHKYRRILTDYFQSCSKCHGEYDKKYNLRKHIIN